VRRYIEALHFNRDILGRGQGLDAVFARYPNLTALVVPSEGNSSMPAAIAGYPMANVPLGYHKDSGAPFGLAFIGRQYDEGSLIRIMSACVMPYSACPFIHSELTFCAFCHLGLKPISHHERYQHFEKASLSSMAPN